MPVEAPAQNTSPDVPKESISNWMQSIGPLETPDPPPKEETNASSTAPPASAPTGDSKPAAAGSPAAPAAAPAKPAETPAKPAAEDDDETKPPKGDADWKKFKEKRDSKLAAMQSEITARDAKIKEFEEKLSKAASQPVTDNEEVKKYLAQIEEAKKLNDQLTERLMLVDVTQDPRFQKYFGDKVSAQIELAKRIVGPDKAQAMEEALKMSDDAGELKLAAIEEVINDLNQIQQSRVGAVLNSLAEINIERESEIAKVKDLRTQKDAKTAEAMKSAEAMRKDLFSRTVKSMQDKEKGFAAYIPRDGDDAWNKSVNERIETANRLLTGEGVKPEDIMQAAMHAAAMPAVLEAYKSDMTEKDAEIAKLTEQLKSLKAAQPTAPAATTAGTGSTDGEDIPIKQGMSPHEAAQAFAKNLSRAMRE